MVPNVRILFSVIMVFALLGGIWTFISTQVQEATTANSQASAGQMQQLVDDPELTEFKKTSDIPDEVKRLLSQDANFRMAEPWDLFDSSCTRQPNGPPARRLMFGAKKPDTCIVCFEEGGGELVRRVAIFQKADGQLRLTWRGVIAPGNTNDLAALRNMWRSEKVYGQ